MAFPCLSDTCDVSKFTVHFHLSFHIHLSRLCLQILTLCSPIEFLVCSYLFIRPFSLTEAISRAAWQARDFLLPVSKTSFIFPCIQLFIFPFDDKMVSQRPSFRNSLASLLHGNFNYGRFINQISFAYGPITTMRMGGLNGRC